jgi:hypothetical protein
MQKRVHWGEAMVLWPQSNKTKKDLVRLPVLLLISLFDFFRFTFTEFQEEIHVRINVIVVTWKRQRSQRGLIHQFFNLSESCRGGVFCAPR